MIVHKVKCRICKAPLDKEELRLATRAGIPICSDCAVRMIQDVLKWLEPILELVSKEEAA